ncbi:MAG TPA: site-2 protease family protein [Bryobacteraceae bacterium]|nr:site-2 protease family protein [Bryobacteraceae bacterium]
MVPQPSGGIRTAFALQQSSTSVARLALHIALFGLTILTTTIVGVVLTQCFDNNRPLDLDEYVAIFPVLWARPLLLLNGLGFSLVLMTILLAHELGHYFACLYYQIDASLPYFLPFPSPIGTLGAFIRIRSPIYTRRALFDVGVAGPLAGFAMLVPALIIGMANSKVVPGIAARGDMIFGVPAIQELLQWLFFPGVASADIYLHPIGRAAWVGTLATALNLLPIGQLDGGHILYSFAGRWHKLLSRVFVCSLVLLAFFSLSWLVWAVLLFFFALRHPVICDVSPMGARRVILGLLALVIFLVTFTIVPLR